MSQPSGLHPAKNVSPLVARPDCARGATLRPGELEGGSFTVGNRGMHGVRSFEPIINFPQTAILAVGSVRTEAQFDRAGGAHSVQVHTLTCVADHRATGGEELARFLAELRRLCEEALKDVRVGPIDVRIGTKPQWIGNSGHNL